MEKPKLATPYSILSKRIRPRVKKANPDKSVEEVTALVKAEFASLSAGEMKVINC